MSGEVKRVSRVSEPPDSGKRREFLRRSGALTGAALMSLVPDAVRQGAWAAGSDAPEKAEVRIGFIPLTDCASVVMASVMGFDRKYGIRITPTKEASWASVRDKLVNGELDAALSNRQKTAQTVADRSYVNTDTDVILARMLGRYDNGIGKKWDEPDYMKFYNDGTVNYPYLSDGMWFMTQHRRWGLLKADPDYLAIAKKVNRIDIYRQAAAAAKAALPKSDFRASKLIDGVVWDGREPKKYAGSFKIKVA